MMVIKIDSLVSTGVGKLEKRLMGGVTLESAQKAISETANAVAEEMDRVSRSTVEQINSENFKAMKKLKNDYLAQLAQRDEEMLFLSTSKSKVEAEKQNILTRLEKLIARVENARTYEEIETFPDGSKIFEKINLNRIRATKTVNKDGKTTQINIVKGNLFRRTTYNPETGKPIRRVTNATKDGKTIEILFNNYGNIKKINPLNVKKVKLGSPIVVDRKVISNGDYCVETETYYSDGSKIKVETEKASGEVYNWIKWDNPNGWWSECYSKDMRTGVIRRGKVVKGKNEVRGYELGKTEYPNGIKIVSPYSRNIDKVTGLTVETTRMTFPKGSSVKRIDMLRMEKSTNDIKHIVVLRNGDKVELTQFKNEPLNKELTKAYGSTVILVPQKAVKIAKNGIKTEIPHDEIRPWLESFHPGYNESLYKKVF